MNTWIVCFGTKWNSPAVYTEKHLVNRFYDDGYRILWVDPIPNRNLTVKRTGSKKVLYKRIFSYFKEQIFFFKKDRKNFYVVKPLFLPNVEKYRELNLSLLRILISILFFLLRIKKYDVISSRNEDIPFLLPKRHQYTFIQISGDLYSDLRGISEELKKEIQKREKIIFDSADVILAASNNIKFKIESIINNKDKIIYFPHGVDYEHFNVDVVSCKLKEIRGKGLPVAGYFGGLTHAVDQSFFLELANNNFSVVLIGPITADFSKLLSLPNVYYLGTVDYEVLPEFGNGFDVCVMAWKEGEWILNSNPSKTYEYIALGKPIVSVYIPEISDNLKQFVLSANAPEEFVKKCKVVINSNNEELVCERKKFAQTIDWNNKYMQVLNFIKTKDVSLFNY